MGLDNYWITKDDQYYCPKRPIRIWGGLFSGPDSHNCVRSFRGEAYAYHVLTITRANLYDRLSPSKVAEAAQKLLEFIVSGKYWLYDDVEKFITPRHWRDLTCMFLWYSCRGAKLEAWW